MYRQLSDSDSTLHRNLIHSQSSSSTDALEAAQPRPLGDFATRTPYRSADLVYLRQLVHLAHKQLPTFQEIDVSVFLKLCLQTNARIVPRETRLLWHQIFNDEVACEYCSTVQACTFCMECNKILCPGCTHTVSRQGARCFDCTQDMINDSNHRPKPSKSPELQIHKKRKKVTLTPKHP